MIITAGTVVTGAAVLEPGWLAIDDDRVTGSGSGTPPRPPDLELGDRLVVPGFVDLHVHGGGGGAYDEVDGTRRAVAFHRAHGTTTTLASLVTASDADLLGSVRRLAELTEEGVVAGIHLEGPWLAESRCGAHQVSELRDPDLDEVRALVTAGRGCVRMITFAPERPGALEAIRFAVDQGVIAAVGHTDASYDTTRAALDAGATVGTHLFNAMTPVHHREPGPIVALTEDPRVTVELVLDGVHVHPAIYRAVSAAVGPDRLVLVTDAMSAAGLPDGAYRLGALEVDVTDGRPTLVSNGSIAGSTATTDLLFRHAVRFGLLPRTEALLAAVRQTSANPARVLGLTDRHLGVGGVADLVVVDGDLDRDLGPYGVLRRGRWEGIAPIG